MFLVPPWFGPLGVGYLKPAGFCLASFPLAPILRFGLFLSNVPAYAVYYTYHLAGHLEQKKDWSINKRQKCKIKYCSLPVFGS